MTGIISITMAIIIMLSTGIVAPPMNNSPMTTITANAKTKPSPKRKSLKIRKSIFTICRKAIWENGLNQRRN